MFSPWKTLVAPSRCLSRCTRTVSTSPIDATAIQTARSTLGVTATIPSSSSPPPPSPSAPRIMDIPPAEDPLLHYLASSILNHGHRSRASRIISRTLLHIHAFTRAPPLPIVRQAIQDAAPAVRTLKHKTGTKTIFKPVALGEKQRVRYAVQAILESSKSQPGPLEERLAREFIAIVQEGSGDWGRKSDGKNSGPKNMALKAKRDIHEFVMVNRGNMGSNF